MIAIKANKATLFKIDFNKTVKPSKVVIISHQMVTLEVEMLVALEQLELETLVTLYKISVEWLQSTVKCKKHFIFIFN